METSPFTPTLNDVVTDYMQLKVEDYQRTFSWGKEQIEELFEDLKECVLSGETHFFGTLILQNKKDERGVATVVDGQQRLTTTFILVATLRDALNELTTFVIAPEKENLMPINVKDKAWKFLYPANNFNEHRFASSRFLRDLMRNSVLAEPEKQSSLPDRDKAVTLSFRKGVRQIRELVRKDLVAFPDEGSKLHRINSLLDALLDRFIVLRVATTSLSESLDIFLTLNNRGLPLGPSDIVRGEIMSALGQSRSEKEQLEIQRDILEEWETIAENVGEPEAFLRHYLVSTSEDKVQKKKVVSAVIKRISGQDLVAKQRAARHFWDDLMSSSVTYSQILNPRMGGDCQYHIELLEGLVKSHRILLLTVLNQEIEESLRNEIVRLTFVLSYRWVIAGKNAQRLEDFYQSQSAALRGEDRPQVVIAALREAIEDFDVNLPRFFSVDADSSFVSRALLHAVHSAVTKGASPIPLDSKRLHLEHIAPQSENEEWVEALFEGNSDEYKDYESVVSSVGNLTLFDQILNIQAQRKPFNEKKTLYTKSVMDVARDLATFETWNQTMVVERTKWLVEMFEIIWSVEPSKAKVVRFSEWFLAQ
jgi:hypothetical protein